MVDDIGYEDVGREQSFEVMVVSSTSVAGEVKSKLRGSSAAGGWEGWEGLGDKNESTDDGRSMRQGKRNETKMKRFGWGYDKE